MLEIYIIKKSSCDLNINCKHIYSNTHYKAQQKRLQNI